MRCVGSRTRLSVALQRHSRRSFTGSLLAATLGAGCRKSMPITLTLSAAASVENAVQAICKVFEEQHSIHVDINTGGSGTLQQQIEQGAPVDVFLAAAPEPMDALERQGLLLPNSHVALLSNTLVLIAAQQATGVWGWEDLARGSVRRIAIGEPSTVPAGQYAEKCLQTLGLWMRVQSKLMLTKSVRQALQYAETGDADAAIVYATDARTAKSARRVANAPPGSHPDIHYPAAVLRRSQKPREAQVLLQFLHGATAQTIFQRHGFRVLPQSEPTSGRG